MELVFGEYGKMLVQVGMELGETLKASLQRR